MTASDLPRHRPRFLQAPGAAQLRSAGLAALAVGLAFAATDASAQTPAAAPAAGGQATPGSKPPSGEPAAEEPSSGEPVTGTLPPGEARPAGPEPIAPVRTFEPVPIPEGMAPPGVRTTPFEPGAAPAPPPAPSGPAPVDARPGARATTAIPGAADAGFVVVDPQRVFGADALPAIGASVVAAAGFSLTASIEARYDDNFLLLPGDLPPGSTLTSRSDIIVTPTASVGLGRQVNRQLFFLNSSAGRTFRLRNPALDADRVALNGGWDWRLGASCSGRVSGSWSTRDLGSTDQLFRTNATRRATDLFTSATCNLPSRLIPGVSAYVGRSRFQNPRQILGFRANSRYWGITPSLGYAFSARGQAGVQFNYQSARFTNQPLITDPFPPAEAPSPGPFNRIESVGVSGFATYRVARRLSANGTLGYTRTSSNNPAIDDFAGWTGSFGLNYSDRRWGASVAGSRGVSLGRDALTNLLVESAVNVAGSYRLRPRVALSAGLDIANLDRRGASVGSIVNPVNVGFDTRRYSFGTDVTLRRRLIMSIDYGHEVREIGAFALKTNSDQVAGTLRFAFR